MDAKITKNRLSRMLSYDWLKIVGIAVAVIIIWVLIFTMTATRITCSQSFVIYNYMGNLSFTNTNFEESYKKAYEKGVFSYEVLEVVPYDLPSSAEYAYTIMDSHLAADEGDVIFVADIDNPSRSYAKDGETLYDSYVQSLVGTYEYRLEDLDPYSNSSYFANMKRYVNSYYKGDYKNNEIDSAKVETDFRTRVKENKDKRFKKESKIQEGIAKDIQRIQSYRNALIEFYGYLEEGLIRAERTTVYDHAQNDKVTFEGVYTLNLCPNPETMGNLVDCVAYRTTFIDESGATQYSKSAENMHIAFLHMDATEPGFEFESLLYVNDLIKTYRTVAE